MNLDPVVDWLSNTGFDPVADLLKEWIQPVAGVTPEVPAVVEEAVEKSAEKYEQEKSEQVQAEQKQLEKEETTKAQDSNANLVLHLTTPQTALLVAQLQ